MLQKLQIDNEPEPEEDNIEVFLRHMTAEYTQSKGPVKKKFLEEPMRKALFKKSV